MNVVINRRLTLYGFVLLLLARPAVGEVKMAIDQAYLDISPYMVDDFKAAYAKIGEPLVIDILPGPRALVAANSGHYSALDARIKGSDQVSNMVAVEVPIYTSSHLVVWTPKPQLVINSITELKRYSVVVSRNSAMALTLLTQYDVDATVVDTLEQAIQMASSRRVDALFASDFLVQSQQQNGLGNDLVIASPSFATQWVYHHIHKSRAFLVPALEKAIRELKDQGLFLLR